MKLKIGPLGEVLRTTIGARILAGYVLSFVVIGSFAWIDLWAVNTIVRQTESLHSINEEILAIREAENLLWRQAIAATDFFLFSGDKKYAAEFRALDGVFLVKLDLAGRGAPRNGRRWMILSDLRSNHSRRVATFQKAVAAYRNNKALGIRIELRDLDALESREAGIIDKFMDVETEMFRNQIDDIRSQKRLRPAFPFIIPLIRNAELLHEEGLGFQKMLAAEAAFWRQMVALTDFLLSGSAEYVEEFDQYGRVFHRTILEELGRTSTRKSYVPAPVGAQETALLESIRRSHREFSRRFASWSRSYSKGPGKLENMRIKSEEVDPAQRALYDILQDYYALKSAGIRTAIANVRQSDETASGVTKTLVLVIFVILILDLIWGAIVAEGIVAPVGRLLQATERMASGDLSARVDAHTDDELGRLRASFDAMADHIQNFTETLESRVAERTSQIEAANKELDAFAASVSHDLRTPLRHVCGFIELLGRRSEAALDDTSRGYLKIICDSATKMNRMIDDLLAFSRLTRLEARMEPVCLNALVAEIIRELSPDHKERRVEWNVEKLPEVGGDPAMLRLALTNLLSNAIKFTRRRETARIDVGRAPDQDGQVVIFVRDNGVGFDMRRADRLFGAFQRLHAKSEYEGTGIGLANVRRIIQRHGGKTWAESVEGSGATFYFSLPKS